MATGYLLVCAGSLGGAALLATSGTAGGHASGWGARLARREVREACAVVGEFPPVAGLLRLDAWREAASELVRRLGRQGVVLPIEEAGGALTLAILATGVLLGLLARSVVGAVAGLAGACVALPLWDAARRRARARALVDEMPEVFRTLAMALGSGETLTQAIEYVGMHERGYAGQAFVDAALRLRCGASTEESMDELARELDAPGVGLLTTALVIAQRTGSPLRSLFQSSARLVERQGEFERMLAVKTAQVRLSVRIVCLLPLLLVCLLSLISVDFQRGVGTPAGMGCVAVAAAMDLCALLIIRRLMRGVL